MAMERTIVGVFGNTTSAENAIEVLHDAGFNNDQIMYSGRGRIGGGFWENLKSMFSGTESTADSVVNDLTNLGLSRDEAAYYAREHQAGHPIVAVRTGDRAQEAAQILQSNDGYSYNAGMNAGAAGGYDQSTGYTQSAYDQRAAYGNSDQHAQQGDYTTAGQYNQPTYDQGNDRATGYDQNASYTDQDANTDEARRLRLREERLGAEKQTVQSGEVHLGKDVVTEQQNIDVPVRHEEVYIERHDLGGRESDAPVGQDETVRVPVREEQVNVTKTPVETGEVRIGKRTVEDTQRVSDTVQREEPRIERSGNMPVRDTTTDEDIDNS